MMQRTLLRGGSVVLPGGGTEMSDVLVTGDTIDVVGPSLDATEGTAIWDASGLTLAPGFIDVHVHGGGGFSLITGNAAEIQAYARWAATRGVTSFLATVCADSLEAGLRAVSVAASVTGPVEGGATVLGLNLEGPFVSTERPGALPPAWLQAPNDETLRQLMDAAGGALRVMTVAPELEGAVGMIETLVRSGVTVSVGHTDATYEQARAGFEAGASHITHAFNAMRPLHHREPGPLGAALDFDGVTIEAIADGVHLHPATVALLVRAFGAGRVCLVTDAVSPAGLGEGSFRIGGHEAQLSEGSIRLPDGTIAGSAATMDAVVRNVVNWGVADLAGAVRMASSTPARALGLESQKGRIAAGLDADIVVLNDDLEVMATWVGGKLVYERG